MPTLHAYLLPHPPLALPAIGRGEERKISKTLTAMDEVAAGIAALAPKTILFISPHATVYGDYFHLAPGEGASGDFSRFGFGDLKMSVEYDVEMAAEIARTAEKHGIPAGIKGERDPALDHGVMVPLWYIRRRYENFKVVRISPSGMPPEAHYQMGWCIAEAVGNAYKNGDAPVVLIASGDLSHALADRGPYGYAPEGPAFDQILCDVFSAGDFQALFDKAAPIRDKAAECGFAPCIMLAGYFHGTETESRLYSYEGPFGVGYAVAGVTGERCETIAPDAFPSPVSPTALARHALENRVLGRPASLPPNLSPELTGRRAGAFVSLHMYGNLRGCIGTIAPTCDNLALEIMQNSVSAGLRDTRFNPITAAELPHLTYKVDVLSAPEPISAPNELDVQRYGVIVTNGYRRGLLLPNLDGIDSVEQQIMIAMQKAGIHPSEPIELERFEVVRYE
ncbi:MAG: AmmeMemoRadiSam system protein A [Defluviitaleaceae bacterium]|nr:AmmeMemoRadiSam system protein A [Defluviitaleaceae bacterium]